MVPLRLLSASENGELEIDRGLILKERETTYSLNVKLPYKLNANHAGFCAFRSFLPSCNFGYSPALRT